MQIGCHYDRLFHLIDLNRAPQIILDFEVETEKLKVWSPYGGLLYIAVIYFHLVTQAH